MISRLGTVLACLAVLTPAAAAPASAHDLCILPETSAPAPGAPLRVALHVSEVFPGEAIDWRPGKTREFFLLTPRGGSISRTAPRRAAR